MADGIDSATGKSIIPAAGGDAAALAAAALKPDLTTLKFDGEGIPEKFRGKTIAEIAKIYGEVETAKTKVEQTNKKWNEWYANEHLPKQKANAAEDDDDSGRTTSRSGVDPRSAFEESQVSALGQMFEVAMNPVVEALGFIHKESLKASRPDFASFEERATEIFNQMPYTHKINPQYGWTFAYNMARAEKLGKEPPPAAPNAIAGGGGAPATAPPGEEPLSAAEDLWAKRFKMDLKEYRKYQVPRED